MTQKWRSQESPKGETEQTGNTVTAISVHNTVNADTALELYRQPQKQERSSRDTRSTHSLTLFTNNGPLDPALLVVTKLYTCGLSRPRTGTSGSAVYALYERGGRLGSPRSLVRHLVKVAEERVAEVDRYGA